MRRLTVAAVPALAGALVLGSARPAAADQPAPLDLSGGVAHTAAREQGPYAHAFGELAIGKGLHTNNPYRLGTTNAVGFTATYLDLGLGVAFGPPSGLQHGGQLSLAIATDGVAQQVLGFSYVALLPVGEHAILRGRAGLPVVLNPDSTVGLEAGLGGAWLLTGGLGLSAELVGSLFYGAATQDRTTTTIPVFALQIGVWFDHEVLP
ncbi:MAG TPA: hypothetical protein VGQ57_16390 [Polyangiaceae bacterium]|nr:hypothetical protein [Polyangiaceae bacterium]